MSEPFEKRMASIRAERRRARKAQRSDSHRAPSKDTEEFELLAAAYKKWNMHRGAPLHDTCPICGELVIVTPRFGESDFGHRNPVCDRWLAFLVLMGAHSPKLVERKSQW